MTRTTGACVTVPLVQIRSIVEIRTQTIKPVMHVFPATSASSIVRIIFMAPTTQVSKILGSCSHYTSQIATVHPPSYDMPAG